MQKERRMVHYEFRYRKYAEALYAALRDDAFYRAMERSVTDGCSAAAMIRYMDYSIVEGERYGEIFMPEDHDYGISVWAKPLGRNLGKERQARKKVFLNDQMGPGSVEMYISIGKFMAEKAAPLIDENSWYLSILGILPGPQGQGLGGGLVSGILEQTDRLGIPTYLETFTARNMPFYARLGYQVVERFREPTVGADYWLMARRASVAIDNS